MGSSFNPKPGSFDSIRSARHWLRNLKRPQQKETRSGQSHPQGTGTHDVPLSGVAQRTALASAQEVPAMIVLIIKVAALIVAALAVAFAWINVSERK